MTGMNELARRAVACKGWRWMRGMYTTSGALCTSDVDEDHGGDWVGELPDLSDPATIGCLFSLALDAGAACPAWLTVEQLVDALEAAP